MPVAERVRSVVAGAAARLYARPGVRGVLRPFFQHRRPLKWIFLVGCYNSGTTIARDLIAAHPEVATLPKEGVRFTTALTRPEDLGWNRMWVECEDHVRYPPAPQPDRVRQIERDWSPWIDPRRALLEKSIANGARLPWLEANFPGAYFLGITRNGYCAAEGIVRRARPRGRARELVGDRYGIEHAGRQWVASNRYLLDDGARLQRFLRFSYEDLMTDPAAALDRIWAFLGLSPHPITTTGAGIAIGGRTFVVRNMNQQSVSRLAAEDVARLDPIIGEVMERLDYPLEVRHAADIRTAEARES